ncbi:MAG: NPCBM/NEW2 domain-containing protein [Phycisphaerae bacterium]|nr:NPCBM/NEW2 domain-containing protein [Phycisphaerae bacterium]
MHAEFQSSICRVAIAHFASAAACLAFNASPLIARGEVPPASAPTTSAPASAPVPTTDDGPASAPVESLGVPLEITTLDGVIVQGRLEAIGPTLALRVESEDGTAQSQIFAWEDLLTVVVRDDDESTASPGDSTARSADAVAPTDAPKFRWSLSDGSEFAGRAVSRDEGGVRLEIRDGQIAVVPLGALRSIERVGADEKSAEKIAELRTQRESSDAEKASRDDTAIAIRSNGSVVLRGTLRSIDAKGLQFAWNQREIPLAWDKLAALFMAQPEPRRGSARVVMADGEVFSGAPSGGDGKRLLLKSSIFRDLELSWRGMRRIELRSDKLAFLSDVPAQSYDFEPLFGSRWEYARDASLTGGPIMLGGRRYAKGIVMHASSTLTFNIAGGGARQFAATVGILDEYSPQGNAKVRLVGDSRVLWESQRVRAGEKPQDVLVELAGVKQLTLVVQRGQNLDIGDHVAWASARLIR